MELNQVIDLEALRQTNVERGMRAEVAPLKGELLTNEIPHVCPTVKKCVAERLSTASVAFHQHDFACRIIATFAVLGARLPIVAE